jgi:DNA replication and repair protein RecF
MRSGMHLAHLSLTNFRNFVRLEKDFPIGPTLLVGANAQGKTSLLEAIHYLSYASSPHTTNDRQLINFLTLQEKTPVTRIVAEIRRRDRSFDIPQEKPFEAAQDRPQRIEIRLVLEPTGVVGEQRLRKEVLLNGIKRRVRDLAGIFNAVMFLPQDMYVIEGPPSERRRTLNDALTQADPTYADALSEYGKVLSQRNALLKQLQERNGDPAELSFWDEQLCEYAATLVRARALALSELENLAEPIHQDLTRGMETLRLKYLPSYHPALYSKGQIDLPMETAVDLTSIGRDAIRSGMSTTLERTRQEEIARGMTLIGPHRDDFSFLANGIDLRLYGSRGQNRTAMLSLKLAEVDWLQQRTGEVPVLLLDEVLSELDTERREDLLARVNAAQQAILTAADLGMFHQDFCKKATTWQIVGGTVSPLQV